MAFQIIDGSEDLLEGTYIPAMAYVLLSSKTSYSRHEWQSMVLKQYGITESLLIKTFANVMILDGSQYSTVAVATFELPLEEGSPGKYKNFRAIARELRAVFRANKRSEIRTYSLWDKLKLIVKASMDRRKLNAVLIRITTEDARGGKLENKLWDIIMSTMDRSGFSFVPERVEKPPLAPIRAKGRVIQRSFTDLSSAAAAQKGMDEFGRISIMDFANLIPVSNEDSKDSSDISELHETNSEKALGEIKDKSSESPECPNC
jgi:hypothetical protein